MVKEIALLITFQVRRIDTESIEVCVAVHDTAVVVVAMSCLAISGLFLYRKNDGVRL